MFLTFQVEAQIENFVHEFWNMKATQIDNLQALDGFVSIPLWEIH